jgi:hypothetical protein
VKKVYNTRVCHIETVLVAFTGNVFVVCRAMTAVTAREPRDIREATSASLCLTNISLAIKTEPAERRDCRYVLSQGD